MDEGYGELLVQRVWELASARLGQCSSFIGPGKLFIVGFRPISDEVGAVLWESERDWNGDQCWSDQCRSCCETLTST